jgi:hypothetical protein
MKFGGAKFTEERQAIRKYNSGVWIRLRCEYGSTPELTAKVVDEVGKNLHGPPRGSAFARAE